MNLFRHRSLGSKFKIDSNAFLGMFLIVILFCAPAYSISIKLRPHVPEFRLHVPEVRPHVPEKGFNESTTNPNLETLKISVGDEFHTSISKNITFSAKKTNYELEYLNFLRLFNTELVRENIRVISLFDDSDVISLSNIDGVATGKHVPYSEIKTKNLEFVLKHLRNKIVFVIGHIEQNGTFTVQNSESQVIDEYSIKQLEEIASKYNVVLILLGCEASKFSVSSTAYTSPVRDTLVTLGIKKSLKASTYGAGLFHST